MTAPPGDRIRVELGARAYSIEVGDGALHALPRVLDQLGARSRVGLVADRAVWRLHGDRVSAALAGRGCAPLMVEPGEASKDWSRLGRLLDGLLAQGLERSDVLLALGGGVVGDLAGLAAALYKRGMRFVQLPTTLLAMADSAVGGKTGVNMAAGKNLVGAFHQPSAVVADTSLLSTLPGRELRAGYAEVAKYGLIDRPDFFAWLEAQGRRVLALEPAPLVRAVAMSCTAKAAIVADDELESGRRALLNLGHTFGHALEADTGMGAALLHGEAVALGMVLALRLSVRRGLCHADEAQRVERHLAGVGLPVSLSALGLAPGAAARLVGHMAHDKKWSGGRLTFVLARGVGRAFLARDVEPGDVEAFLADELQSA